MDPARRVSLLMSVIVGFWALGAGCAPPPRGVSRADQLAGWLEHQSFSSWSTFRRQVRQPAQPSRPDGLTLGSPNVFAAIGCSEDDLTSVDVFWGDRRRERPFARSLTMAVSLDGGEPEPLGGFEEQSLRRVRSSAIAVSESSRPGLTVTCVDFAPMAPEDNFLARWLMVENTTRSRREVSIVVTALAPGEWRRAKDRVWWRGEGLAFVSDTRMDARENSLTLRLGRLEPGERRAAALLVVAAAEPGKLRDDVLRAETRLDDLLALLEDTRADWERWCATPALHTGDERMDDLLDSLLCLVRSHVGPEALHTGSLRYPHNRAWIRDSYWVQRALLELGRPEEARRGLDFFHRAWRAGGVASSYEIPSGKPVPWGYAGVELPHYLVLMVRDAERLGGLDPAPYWDLVSGCLDAAAVPESGLQPMNGDETWLLAAPVRELDDLLGNSWLLIASAEYGADLAARVGDEERAGRYRAMAATARRGLERFIPRRGQAEWYAVGRGGDGSLDLSLAPGVLARGAVLGAVPAADPHLSAGLVESWRRLGFEGGMRSHARSATIEGGAIGYVLWAAAGSPASAFLPELVGRVPRLCSATGCVWEFHDLYDSAWGGEKRRLWDSAVVLMGLTRALFERRDGPRGVEFVPRPLTPRDAASPAPPFDAEALLARRGEALILHDRSPEHARLLARELLRHRDEQYPVAEHAGPPPEGASAIIIARRAAPAGWRATPRGYWVRAWAGPPQLWVHNKGNVYLDTDPLLVDLLSLLAPHRARPLPHPDASFDLVARLGEPPAGEAGIVARMARRTARGSVDLGGGRASVELAEGSFSVQTATEANRLRLTVTAPPLPAAAELSVTLPAGWWLVYARDMSGRWDRVRDPVRELRLPDGRLELVYSLRASGQPRSVTFDLARLRVVELETAER